MRTANARSVSRPKCREDSLVDVNVLAVQAGAGPDYYMRESELIVPHAFSRQRINSYTAARSSDGDAVIFCLAEDGEKVGHLEQVAKLLAEMKQLELASYLP